MSLVLTELAAHPAAPPGLLRAIATALPDPFERIVEQHRAAIAVLVHPATPVDVRSTVPVTLHSEEDLHYALTLAGQNSTGIRAALDRAHPLGLHEYGRWSKAHPAAVTALLTWHLAQPASRRSSRTMAQFINHPGVRPDLHVRVLAAVLADGSAGSDVIDAAVTAATRYDPVTVGHLARTTRDPGARRELARYSVPARLSGPGAQVRLAQVLARAHGGDAGARRSVITDPRLAPRTVAELLVAWSGQDDSLDLALDVLSCPPLASTTVAYTATFIWCTEGVRATAPVQSADDLLRAVAQAADLSAETMTCRDETVATMACRDMLVDVSDPDALEAWARLATRDLPTLVAVLVHPAASDATRTFVAAALSRAIEEDDLDDSATDLLPVARRLGTDPTALLDAPVPALSCLPDTTAVPVRAALRPALDQVAPHLAGTDIATAFVALAPGFPGTLAELVDAARTVGA